jgi:hypothetical protein
MRVLARIAVFVFFLILSGMVEMSCVASEMVF